MYKPVLIGSRAAAHNGFLPPWRNGQVDDTDVACERSFVDRFQATFGGQLFERPGNRGFIASWVCRSLNYVCDERLALMNDLCWQTATFEWSMGEEVLIATPEVIWATRVHTVAFNPRNIDKATQDLAFYESMSLQLKPEHHELAELVRALDQATLDAIRADGSDG